MKTLLFAYSFALGLVLPLVISSAAYGAETQQQVPPNQEQLLKRIQELEKRLAEMEVALGQTGKLFHPSFPFGGQPDDLDEFMSEFRELMEKFRSNPENRMPSLAHAGAYLGIEFRDLTPKEAHNLDLEWGEGIVVKNVFDNSPAEKANLLIDDVIVELNGRKIRDTLSFVNTIRSGQPGDTLKMTILRNGAKQEISAVLGSPEEAPDEFTRSVPRRMPPLSPWGMSIPQLPQQSQADEIPPIEIKIQTDGGEAILSISTSALALTEELRIILKLSEKEEKMLEQVLADARNELARKLTPIVSSSMETSGGMRFDASGVQTALDDVLKNLEAKLPEILSKDKLSAWLEYVKTHKYISQSFSIKRGFGAPASPSKNIAPPSNIRTF